LKQERKIVLEITPKSNWWDLNISEIWSYRDLIKMFVKRDFVAFYKQTILGPLWYVIQPVLTTGMFLIVFNRIAGIQTGSLPPILFYLSGLVVWNYFSQCLVVTSNTFIKNASIFGKVYFPRLTMPIATVISNFISFGIQFALLVVACFYYSRGHWPFDSLILLLWLPVISVLLASIGLGLGLIISALTTKYRDLSFLVSFGVQLMMYGTPVIYSVASVSEKYRWLILLNPISQLIELFRLAILGKGYFEWNSFIYSAIFSIASLILGMAIFNKVEKNFMDVV
jgi:lipopolysaccharide transport system permease protein